MNLWMILYIRKELARKIYFEGLKTKAEVTEVLNALTNQAEKESEAKQNPDNFFAVQLKNEFAADWVRTLQNLPDVVDQVLAAYLRGAFAQGCGFQRDVDNNWTLVE